MGPYRAHGRLSLVGDRATAREVQTVAHKPLRSDPLPLSLAYNPAETPTRRPCCKLWRRPQDGRARPRFSRFVNRETEAEREQPVLLAHRPRAGKAETLAQPQHRLESLDRAPRRVEGLEAANPRHGPLDPEVVTLDALPQVLGHVVHRGARQEPILLGCRDGGWVGPRSIRADPVGGE